MMRAKMLPKLALALALALAGAVPVLARAPIAAPALRPALQAAAVTIDLYAVAGTWSGDNATPIWAFSTSAAPAPTLPGGPVLDVVAGSAVTIHLHNNLPAGNVSLLLPGIALAPDMTGVGPGGTATYNFTASDPGTYLYQSGVDAQFATPMGLYGAMIVRPAAAGQAYGDAASIYDVEAALVLSELDPNLNTAIAAGIGQGAALLNYSPDYFLINGKAYPGTGSIAATAGQKVLFRYVNAGLLHHTMMVLGLHQRAIAADGYLHPVMFDTFSPTLAAGQTQDLIATPAAGSYPIFSREQHVTNAGSFPGGMLIRLEVAAP